MYKDIDYKDNIYDIAIIGGGICGCTIARLLSKYDLKVALYSMSVILFTLFAYSAYIYYFETKKFGKLKIIHSFSYCTLFVGYFGINIPINTLYLLTNELENITIYYPFLVLTAIVLANPGTPSNKICPLARRPTRRRSSKHFWPTITF